MADGVDVTIRPIRPQDAAIEQAFVRGLSPETKFFRFMNALRELTPAMLARFTQIDYSREMALIAVIEENAETAEIGIARYAIDPGCESCEIAIVVGDRWQRRGVGAQLFGCLIDAARWHGLRTMEGDVLANNTAMLRLAASLGFTIIPHTEDPAIKRIAKTLSSA